MNIVMTTDLTELPAKCDMCTLRMICYTDYIYCPLRVQISRDKAIQEIKKLCRINYSSVEEASRIATGAANIIGLSDNKHAAVPQDNKPVEKSAKNRKFRYNIDVCHGYSVKKFICPLCNMTARSISDVTLEAMCSPCSLELPDAQKIINDMPQKKYNKYYYEGNR